MAEARGPGFFLGMIGWLIFGAVVLWAGTVALIVVAGACPAIRKADVILVLGAAQYNGKPSPVLQARLDHGIALYKRGLAKKMVMTGGVGVGDTISEGEAGRRYAVKNGVPDSAIIVEGHGVTSAESVRDAAELMRARKLSSALVVSDAYHMLRLELLARRAGIQPFRAPVPTDRAATKPNWRYVMRESLIFPATAVLGAK